MHVSRPRGGSAPAMRIAGYLAMAAVCACGPTMRGDDDGSGGGGGGQPDASGGGGGGGGGGGAIYVYAHSATTDTPKWLPACTAYQPVA